MSGDQDEKEEPSVVQEKEETVQQQEEPTSEDILTETVYTTEVVRVRKEPSIDGETAAFLNICDAIERIADDGTWNTVLIDGETYYIAVNI